MAGVHREAIQKQIHQDWANREYIEVITTSIKRITDFLNSFGESGCLGNCDDSLSDWMRSVLHSNCYLFHMARTQLVMIQTKNRIVIAIFFSFCRHVVPVAVGRVEWKVDSFGTSHRLFGSVCNKGRNISIKPSSQLTERPRIARMSTNSNKPWEVHPPPHPHIRIGGC